MIRKIVKSSDTKDENLVNCRDVAAKLKGTSFRSTVSSTQNTENLNERLLAVEKQLSKLKGL